MPGDARSDPLTRGAAASDLGEARAAAQRSVAARAHTETTLRRRLEQRGFARAVARAVAAEAARHGWVDDRAVASLVAERLVHRGTGIARIAAELRARGVGEASIEEVLAPIDSERELESAAAMARRLASRLPTRTAEDDDRRAARLAGALARRGFSASAIRAAVSTTGLPAPPVD